MMFFLFFASFSADRNGGKVIYGSYFSLLCLLRRGSGLKEKDQSLNGKYVIMES